MGNVYTGIDIGTNSIKIVVVEKHKNKFNLLASSEKPCSYMKNGEVTNTKGLSTLIKSSKEEIENMLGLEINKAICALDPVGLEMSIVQGKVEVEDPNNIQGVDISNLLNDVMRKQIFDETELVMSTPIYFIIDGVKKVKDPKGCVGKTLECKIVVSSVRKSNMYRILESLKLAGIDTTDVCFKSTGDYYTVRNASLDSKVGAIINIGETSTNISIFNKGIQIKNGILNMGSLSVDKDISYIYNCSVQESRRLKENFGSTLILEEDEKEITEYIDNENIKKNINKLELSKVIEARIKEILKLSLDEIKNLTNREISYIIVTGGLSEINGMEYLVDNYFGNKGKVSKINVMGIRNNKFSSALGSCIYFDEKLSLRGKTYNMVSAEDYHKLVSTNEEMSGNNVIGKMFGHFFGN